MMGLLLHQQYACAMMGAQIYYVLYKMKGLYS